MTSPGTLKIATPTDCEIVLTRVFDAPRQMVFDALTKPELLRRWFALTPPARILRRRLQILIFGSREQWW